MAFSEVTCFCPKGPDSGVRGKARKGRCRQGFLSQAHSGKAGLLGVVHHQCARGLWLALGSQATRQPGCGQGGARDAKERLPSEPWTGREEASATILPGQQKCSSTGLGLGWGCGRVPCSPLCAPRSPPVLPSTVRKAWAGPGSSRPGLLSCVEGVCPVPLGRTWKSPHQAGQGASAQSPWPVWAQD